MLPVTGLLGVLVVAILGLLTLRLVAAQVGVDRSPVDALPWTSGHLPTQHALSRHHARWYVASVVFLAFDVEMLFMYPWAVVVADLGAGAVVEMFGFLAVLVVAVVWARREGAFRWA